MTATLARQENRKFSEVEFCETGLIVDPRGCLYWPDENLLVFSDLHLEKGSSFAARKGVFIPPYDTKQTLTNMALCVADWQPATVVSLGDSFHDADASMRLPESYRHSLARLMEGLDWVWISGNHDPEPPRELGGIFCEELHIGPLNFVHQPLRKYQTGEIAGHLHPCAKIRRRGKSVRRHCFVGDDNRLIMPAFGAFTGGLNIRDDAYEGLFDPANLRAWMLSGTDVYEIAGKHLVR